MSEEAFKYDSVSWGVGGIKRTEKTLAGRKLDHCLKDIGQAHGKILEIGCARGRFIRSIKAYRPDLEAHACDINRLAIELNKKENDGVIYSEGDAMRLPYSESTFDAVVFFDLIEHLEDPLGFLVEIKRVLKPAGLLHCYLPCEGQPGTLHWLLWKIRLGHDLKRKHRGHIQRFSSSEALRLLEQAGFNLQRIRFSGYWIEQILDIAFYALLELKAIKDDLWEAHAEGGLANQPQKKGLVRRLLGGMRNIAFAAGFYESKIVYCPPLALGLHASAAKRS